MDRNIELESYVNESDFLIKITSLPSTHYIIIYGEYDEWIQIRGSSELLNQKVQQEFLLQPEIIGLSYRRTETPGWGVLEITMKEGSNFFELDFSELNKVLDGTEHSHFRW